jgi:hypothetical protein
VESERSEQLARRIRTLERVHRPLAILVGMLVGGSVLWKFDDSETMLANYGVTLAVALGAATWLLISMVLIGVLAIFETRHHRIVSTTPLPQATLVTRK